MKLRVQKELMMTSLKIKKLTICFVSGIFILIALNSNAEIQNSSPVGIISSVEGNVSIINKDKRAADFGDDIFYKDKIKVAENSSLVVTYYTGCQQEWFNENTLIEIGQNSSQLISGKIHKTEAFDCEVPEVVLSDKDSFKKATFHVRSMAAEKNKAEQQIPKFLRNKQAKSVHIYRGEQSSKAVKLKIWAAKDEIYYHSGEHIVLYLVSNKDAYLKLDYFQANRQVVHLVPNIFRQQRKIMAGRIYTIGGSKAKQKLVVEEPYGEEKFNALLSLEPFDMNLQSFQTIEDSMEYKKLLSDNKTTPVSEYEFKIWTLPGT